MKGQAIDAAIHATGSSGDYNLQFSFATIAIRSGATPMILHVAIDADPEWDSSTDWRALAVSATAAAIAESAFPGLSATQRPVEVSIRLAGDEEVHALNAQWRAKDMPTNVLSFPMAEGSDLDDASRPGPDLMLGDIILAHGVCASEAADKAISIESHAAHLMIHGTLHLLGHDHGDETAAADMEAREIRAMARLGIADPYAFPAGAEIR